MALANLEAVRLNHNYLAPAHLLLGLIAESNCVATETLRILNVDLDRVRTEVCAHIKQGEGPAAVGRRAHTQELKDVISLAIQEARKFGHRYVGTEHLILGLLAYADGLPSKVLRQQGLNLDTLREKVLAMLRSSVDPSHDLAHSRHGDFEWVHQQELAKAFRSPTFWHTMILAVDAANRLGAGEVEPKHLLMALLRDSSNGLADALREKGVTLDWLTERAPS
jgi:ATP-dependent Clp protease ATP-binding subunit ClpA